MKRTNGNRALLRAVALGQILLLVVAGCKSTSDKGTKAQVVNQSLVGKDGAVTVTDPNMVVNDYAALATDAAVNDPSVTVASGGLSGLAAGDLVLIIQMAGATINTTDDTSAFGTVTGLGSAGNYELVGVTGFSANTIALGSNLHNSYTVAGKTQVIRVPQYTTLTINSGASIIAPPWDGAKGGVVALQAATTLDLNGAIDVSATGFRGGATHTGNASAVTDLTIYRSADPNDGAEKGESIAGDPNTLAFPYGRGAPANGGGGGNWHNGGGGGGANAAASGVGSDAGGPNWNGQGVMLSSVTGAAAWSLDPGYAMSGGPGGGRGGYTYSALNGNALADPPGDAASWGGNSRRERGGLGGHPLTSSPTGKLFLGGGGGAGDGNNLTGGNLIAGPGGRGGGLVFVIAGTVTGTGSILANGADGGNANSNGSVSGDGPGGGGGGGTVVVHAGTLATAIVVRANGGVGGNQININSNAEAEGPGGGGGGGYVALSGGTPTTVTADGRLGGTTSASNGVTSALSEFPSNGATAGQAGLIDATAASSMHYYTNPAVTMAIKPTDPTSVGAGTFSLTSPQSGVTFECNLDGAGYATCPASYTTADLADGSHTLLVQGKDLNGNLSASPASWTWNVLHALDLDGGLDAEAEEAGSADVAALDVPPVPEDAGTGLDAGEGLDGLALLDTGEDTNGGSGDGPGTVVLLDAAARLDVAVAVDVPPLKLDAPANGGDTNGLEDASGDGSELEVSAQDAQPVVVVDPPSSDASSAADQAVSPPLLDAAGTTIADAAVPGGPDAAVPSFKAMGGGFCAVSPMHDSAPGLFTFFLVAAFGLLVVRRRRR